MHLVIQKLKKNYPELFESKEKISLEFKVNTWEKLSASHLSLTIDFSLLCQQIRAEVEALNNGIDIDLEKLKTSLKAALLFASLLEVLYDDKHLNVPRELKRIEDLKKSYHQILFPENKEEYMPLITNLSFWLIIKEWIIQLSEEELELKDSCFLLWESISDWASHLSLAQWIRAKTFNSNLWRLLSARSRRFFEMIQIAGLGSANYGKFIELLNLVALPFFTWLAWIFFLPRLLASLFVLTKNTLYTREMSQEQLALGFWGRFCAQFKRRWFHLGNDSVWESVGLLNCFVLTGALGPIGAYLTVAAFTYDVLLAVLNISIELYRLNCLRNQYKQMLPSPEQQKHLSSIEERMLFEALRLGINVLSTTAIVLSASLALPLFASIPAFPLIGAALLVIISILAFWTNKVIEENRPKETLEDVDKKPLLAKLGFFASNKVQNQPNLDDANVDECYALSLK